MSVDHNDLVILGNAYKQELLRFEKALLIAVQSIDRHQNGDQIDWGMVRETIDLELSDYGKSVLNDGLEVLKNT